MAGGEISFALALKKPIIPCVFVGGIPPITIINHTWLSFADWDTGFSSLLTRLQGTEAVSAKIRRQMELAYLQDIGRNMTIGAIYI